MHVCPMPPATAHEVLIIRLIVCPQLQLAARVGRGGAPHGASGLGLRIGLQGWASGLAVGLLGLGLRVEPQGWSSGLVLRVGPQGWSSGLVLRVGGWASGLVLRFGPQGWSSGLGFKQAHGLQGWGWTTKT